MQVLAAVRIQAAARGWLARRNGDPEEGGTSGLSPLARLAAAARGGGGGAEPVDL